MSNYPEGSMRGSGIYSYERDTYVTCDECGHEFEETLSVNDWGNINADVTCPECGADFSVSIEHTDPEPDYDSMYKERDL
jgi:transcription elongation factor Elf1